MPEPLHSPARKWTTSKRYSVALRKVLDEDWKVTDAIREYGVDRKTFYRRLKDARIDRGLEPTATQQRRVDSQRRQKMRAVTERQLAGEKLLETVTSPAAEMNARLPIDPDEFNRTYFGHFACPDCGDRHPSPPFHSEILGICQDEHIRRGIILCPPYHAKTTVANVRDTVYDTVHDVNFRTMIISESKPFAELIVSQIGQLLTDHTLYEGAERNLIDDFGPFYMPGNTWNSESLVVIGRNTSEKDPTVQALGYRGQIYGRRADKIKTDDLATQQNQSNPEMVAKMIRWIDAEVLSRIGRKSRFIMIGTRVIPGDIYGTMIEREGYHVVKYPAILDEADEQMLWPEHFPFDDAILRRQEMDPAMWQLVYQNVDSLTEGTAFRAEDIDACFDPARGVGHHEPQWFLVAGLDPAGAGKDSGYTAMVLLALDAHTGERYLVDAYAQKQMRAPELKAKMLEWSDQYPIYEWRVEANGVQRNLIQYNEDIIRPLAARGVRVDGHVTGANKWDPQFGVESMAPLFASRMMSIPYHNRGTDMYELTRQLKNFPLMPIQDLAMALWFAELGCRAIIQRPSLPMFSERTQEWPERIRKRRHMVDFSSGHVQRIPLHDQRQKFVNRASRRRMVVGRPTLYPNLVEGNDPRLVPFMNKEGYVEVDDSPEGAEDLMTGWDAEHEESDLTKRWKNDA